MQHIRQTIGTTLGTTLGLAVLLLSACATAPETREERATLSVDAVTFVANAKSTDSSLARFFDSCAGYAVFPEIGKGGLIVGGAYGRGQLFDHRGRLVGYCDVSQGSIGAQIGGQTFGELVFFETDQAMTNFKGGKFALSAQASAVALSAIASNSIQPSPSSINSRYARSPWKRVTSKVSTRHSQSRGSRAACAASASPSRRRMPSKSSAFAASSQ